MCAKVLMGLCCLPLLAVLAAELGWWVLPAVALIGLYLIVMLRRYPRTEDPPRNSSGSRGGMILSTVTSIGVMLGALTGIALICHGYGGVALMVLLATVAGFGALFDKVISTDIETKEKLRARAAQRRQDREREEAQEASSKGGSPGE